MPGSTKHACPGVHHPMPEADGLLARIRVPGGRLTIDQWAGVARAAATHGSGVIELTSRANLQLRGVEDGAVGALTTDLVALGLTHPDPRADERRNVVGAPATGLDPTEVTDVSGLVVELSQRLARTGTNLHPKAGVLVDAGGAVSVRGRRADVALGAVRRTDTGEVAFEVAVGGALPIEPGRAAERIPVVTASDAARWAVATLTAAGDDRPTDLPGDVARVDGSVVERTRPGPGAPLGDHDGAFVGAAPLLGRLDAVLALDVASLLRRHAVTDVRLTPWRSLIVAAAAGTDLLAELAARGLVTDATDPAATVVACAGRAGCTSGATDTIADATRAIARLRADPPAAPFTLHLSGCPKRCASHAAHDLTLIAAEAGDGYDAFDGDEVAGLRAVPVELALEACGR